MWNLTLKISRAFHYHVVDLALSVLFLMCEDVKNEFNRRIKVDLRSETYFKKIGNLVFRYNVMLPYRSNRTGKICHDSTSEQQNLNVTILKCLCVLSACRLRSAFMQSIDCPCLCQVLFSKTKQLNLLNTKDIYIYIEKKVFPPHGKLPTLRTFKIFWEKKNWRILEL